MTNEVWGGKAVTIDCICREGFSQEVAFELNTCIDYVASFCKLVA